MADQQLPAEQVDRIRDSYAFDEPAVDLGVLDNGGAPVTDARIRIPLRVVTRHGLIACATETGKTITLQLLAESLSAADAGTVDRMVGASGLGPRYTQPIDRESAQEILAARLAAGARAAEAESARLPRPGPAPGQKARRGRPHQKKSVVERVAESSILKQFARSAGREIVRSLFGTGRRR